MSGIDERIVSMRFNNSQFESGVKQTMNSLNGLKTGLNLDGSKKSLEGLAEAGKNFSLGGIASGVESIASKFSALSIIGITALTNIANKAINAGSILVKSLTVDPVKAGLDEYELKMGSIQTILSNTSKAGTTLDEVTASLDSLNTYADKTIYNFGDMTKNIGLFTNAGIGIADATSMIKGFSNEAAASGTSSQGAAGAAYQLSQALSSGTIRLMDWKSLTNVGMGNKNMQSGIIEIAEAMGEFEGTTLTAKTAGEDFNASLEQNWLSADVMQNYLKIQAGELSDEQMKALNLTDDQITAFKKQATISEEAATKVRTWTQLIGTLQEGVGSGWSQTFDLLIGNFDQATALWTKVNDTLGPMISASGDARNALLKSWVDLGGRDVLIEGISNAFNTLLDIIQPIKEAFREIFPPMTGETLLRITQAFTNLTAKLKLSGEEFDSIKSIFKGVFSIISIGMLVVEQLFYIFKKLFLNIFSGSGDVLAFAGRIGDFFTQLNESVQTSDSFFDFFHRIGDALVVPIDLFKVFIGYIQDLFGKASEVEGTTNVEDALERVSQRLEPFKSMIDLIQKAFSYFGVALKKVWEFFTPMANAIADFFGQLSASVSESLQTMDFSTMLDVINTGLFAGLILLFKKFLNGGGIDLSGGFLDSINGAFEGLTGTMSAMQAQLKAGTLVKIASAIALLTVSVVALSLIDSGKLTSALTAMTVMFLQLFGAMAIFEKISASSGFAKMPLIAAAMILLSVAVLILTVAVRNLAGLDWEELAKGLTGVTVLLGVLAGTAKIMSTNSGGLISAGIGMIAVAVAIKVLVSAVKDFSEMSWGEMAKGFAGVAAALTALALFSKFADLGKIGVSSSVGLILLAVSLKVIASALKDFADMNWEEMGQGMTGMALSLAIIAGAMQLMPKNMLVTAVSLAVVGASLLILAEVLKSMATMSWEELGQGMVGIAGALLIIAGAMYLMSGALPGALALIVVAGALAILIPVLQSLAAMSWEELGMGLAALAAVFLVLGVAALVLTPVIPAMLGLGVAIVLLGVGTLAAGAGLLAFSAGLTALSIAGGAGTAALVAMVGAIIGLIPTALAALATGIIEFARIIGESAPVFIVAMVALIMSLLTAINTVAPNVIATLINLITMLLKALTDNIPKFLVMGLKMIVALLDGIADNIDDIVASALNIVTQFINGISKGLPGLVESGVNLIVTFVESLATSIRNNSDRMSTAAVELADAIIDGITGGIKKGASKALNAVKDMAKGLLDGAKNLLGINSPSKEFFKVGGWSAEGLANGIDKTSGVAIQAGRDMGENTLDALKKTMARLGDAVSMDMDMTPTIRPVLDLSDIRNGSSLINGLLMPNSLDLGTSYSKAASIAEDSRPEPSDDADNVNPEKASLTFNQYNSSPKALSEAEIYRQTKNQISVAKGAMKV